MFIVFEGLDGSGKTTQVKMLKEALSKSHDVILTREPGGTPTAEKIRELILDPTNVENFPTKAEALLYYTSRIFHTDNVIKPALQDNKIVISDRYNYSTMAYQVARGACDLDSLLKLDDWCLEGFKPDVVIYLSIDPNVSYDRTLKRGSLDRLEKDYKNFANKAHSIFIEMCYRNSEKSVIINADQSIDRVHKEVLLNLKRISNKVF